MKRAIFLDRDGVINKILMDNGKPISPRKFGEFKLLPRIEEVLRTFKKTGFMNIVVSNQPDIARGLIEEKELEKMHLFIRERLIIDDILICPHDNDDNCLCRKPKPGMLLEAAKKWNIDLNTSFLIGDTWRDIGAGKKAGCKTILIDTHYNKTTKVDFRVPDIVKAMEIILNGKDVVYRGDSYISRYLDEVGDIAKSLVASNIERMIELLLELREKKGRLFFIGVGGGAGNATHAVNDFRKIAGFEVYTPTDNVCELTARINDEGWQTVFVNWLKGCRLNASDGVFIFSVGGGNEEKNISVNIVEVLKYAKSIGAKVFGIVGRDGGYTAKVADTCVIIPTINSDTVTPHTESFQAVIWHLLVSHPKMKVAEMKWESVK